MDLLSPDISFKEVTLNGVNVMLDLGLTSGLFSFTEGHIYLKDSKVRKIVGLLKPCCNGKSINH